MRMASSLLTATAQNKPKLLDQVSVEQLLVLDTGLAICVVHRLLSPCS
jgi:hypothetical protein